MSPVEDSVHCHKSQFSEESRLVRKRAGFVFYVSSGSATMITGQVEMETIGRLIHRERALENVCV